MILHYFKSKDGNFGDDLNAWLWPRLLPDGFFDGDEREVLVGIGTLLNHRIPKAKHTIVFGSGFGYGTQPLVDESWNFICVRGPKTAAALGLAPELAITDPAILIHEFTREAVATTPGRVGFLPHCDSAEYGDWNALCKSTGLAYIDPRWSVDRVISAIGRCSLLLTEAMHGAIFADAMRVPWSPWIAYDHISIFKWQDWCESMGLNYLPTRLPPLWRGDGEQPAADRIKNRVKRLAKATGLAAAHWTSPPPERSTEAHRHALAEQMTRLGRGAEVHLSKDSLHADRIAQLHDRLDQLRALRSAQAAAHDHR